MLPIIILLVIGAAILYVIFAFNGLVALKKQIKASVQEIGNQLKRQAELIPNLTESVKGYLEHEKDIFEKLAKARQSALEAVSSGSAEAMAKAAEALSKALAPIRAVFESNPQLQAVSVVKDLMDNLRDTADKVAYARRLLIDLVAEFNTKVATFPGMLIAKFFKFKEEKSIEVPEEGKHLGVTEEETKTPKVDLNTKE